MRYIGSKNRISKYLKPIIESYLTDTTDRYIEPFVGGANMIDKINFPRKHGIDNHKGLIELLKYVRDGGKLPTKITEGEHRAARKNPELFEPWYVACAGFCASFGADFNGGYARNKRGETDASWSKGALNNLRKQSPHLHGIEFEHGSYEQLTPENTQNCVIYCDPPYRNTTKYSTSADFDHDAFYDWVRAMSTCNTVLVSEYEMPDDFICIWERELPCKIDSTYTVNIERVEKLYVAGGDTR